MRNTIQNIQLFEDEVKKMKEKTEAKLQQSLQDLIAELSQLQQEIEPLKQEICNLQVSVLTAEFECPVYFEIMGPPKEVFQCPIGHFICGDCNLQGSFMTSYVCRTPLGGLGNFTRNWPMEQIIRTYPEVKV